LAEEAVIDPTEFGLEEVAQAFDDERQEGAALVYGEGLVE